METTCCHQSKHRDAAEKKRLLNRLSRIEGQVRGVHGMVENDAYCADILRQVSAITSALRSFQSELLGEHIRTCVKDDIRDGKDETVEELIDLLRQIK